jgi:hypothetical protein
VATIIQSHELKPATPERPERVRTLSERNQNVPEPEYPSFDTQVPSPTISANLPPGEQSTQLTPIRRTLFPPTYEDSEKSQPQPILPHRSSMPARSILRTRNTNEHDYSHSHFKSPSLGNLCEKPSLSPQYDHATLPRVGCRKRTNTLSVDNSARLKQDLAVCEEMKVPERRRPLEHNALKRHAIYTQSLYVPHDERNSFSGRMFSASECKRPPFLAAKEDTGYSISSRPQTLKLSLQPDTPVSRPWYGHDKSLSGNNHQNVLGLTAFPLATRSMVPSSSFARDLSSDSQSSISSIYSQDGPSFNSQAMFIQTRPLTQTRLFSDYELIVRRRTEEFGKGVIVHHPMIVALLAEVDDVMNLWQSI